jgi:hypothetical protein
VIPIELPEVTRVQDEHGDHIEPPLDTDADEATKLAWHAAVVAHDTGLRITLHDRVLSTDGPGWYSLTIERSSISALRYRDAWSYLNGVDTGARAVRQELISIQLQPPAKETP